MARSKTQLGLLVALGLLGSVACGGPPGSAPSPPSTLAPQGSGDRIPKGGVTEFFTHNVVYRVDPDVVVDMPDMNADIRVYDQNKPFVPANIDDFMVQVHTCHLGIDEADMAALMNKYVFNYPGCPISNIKITCLDGRIVQTATMTKFGIPISTELSGPIQPNGKGQIVFHPDSIKSAGIPVKGLLDLIGMEVASLINSRPDHGIEIQDDDVIMYPDRMMPLPVLRGKVMGVEVTPGHIEMDWNDGIHRDMPPLPRPAQNFILMWGGNTLIDNNLALDTKFEMIDDTPQDPMYYNMKYYREQLQAGFTIALEDGASIAYLSDVKGSTPPQGTYTPQLPLNR